MGGGEVSWLALKLLGMDEGLWDALAVVFAFLGVELGALLYGRSHEREVD